MSTDFSDTVIAYQLGAPGTNGGQLVWSLRKIAGWLLEQQIVVPRPGEYRDRIPKALKSLDGAPATPDLSRDLMRQLTRDRAARRIVLSNDKYLGVPAWIFYTGVFYHNAAPNAAALRNLFPDNPCEFHLMIANPAIFIPAVFETQRAKSYEKFIQGVDPLEVRWSDVIARIRAVCPDVPIRVCCNEDSPVIWGDVLRHLAGLPSETVLETETEMAERLLEDAGAEAMKAFLDAHPKLTSTQRQDVLVRFLEKFARDDLLDEVIDLPGWTEELITQMSLAYDVDLELIAEMEGVELIEP